MGKGMQKHVLCECPRLACKVYLLKNHSKCNEEWRIRVSEMGAWCIAYLICLTTSSVHWVRAESKKKQKTNVLYHWNHKSVSSLSLLYIHLSVSFLLPIGLFLIDLSIFLLPKPLHCYSKKHLFLSIIMCPEYCSSNPSTLFVIFTYKSETVSWNEAFRNVLKSDITFEQAPLTTGNGSALVTKFLPWVSCTRSTCLSPRQSI